jgi:hypothetical protein
MHQTMHPVQLQGVRQGGRAELGGAWTTGSGAELVDGQLLARVGRQRAWDGEPRRFAETRYGRAMASETRSEMPSETRTRDSAPAEAPCKPLRRGFEARADERAGTNEKRPSNEPSTNGARS